jgi:hypothetical protein
VYGGYVYERHYCMVVEKVAFILLTIIFGVVVSTSMLALNKQEDGFSKMPWLKTLYAISKRQPKRIRMVIFNVLPASLKM